MSAPTRTDWAVTLTGDALMFALGIYGYIAKNKHAFIAAILVAAFVYGYNRRAVP